MGNTVQWRNAGEVSRYPFRETAGLLSTSNFQLPEGFLVDAQIFKPASFTGSVYLSQLTVSGNLIRGVITAGLLELAQFSIALADLKGGTIPLTNAAGLSRGVIVLGQQAIEIFSKLKLGTNLFAAAQTEFEASCVCALPLPIVNSISTGSVAHSGKIAMVEGVGIRLEKLSDNALRISAVGSTDGLERCCQEIGEPIRFINEAAPNQYGTIILSTEPFNEPEEVTDDRQVLRISTVNNGLVFYLSK